MPHSNSVDQGRAVIDEYLETVDWCLSGARTGQSLLGYPATLLLFSVVDAISHSGRTFQRGVLLDVLNAGTTLNLRPEQLQSLAKFFRHKLAHAAITMQGSFILPDPTGPVFEFNGDDVKLIRVIPFRDLVRQLWAAKRATFDTSAQLGPQQPQQLAIPPGLNSVTPASSGCSTLSPSASGVS